MKLFVSFVCGVIFALGLGISGMTNPEKVLGFLTLTEAWDPSLAFVMVGAIAVHSLSYLVVKRKERPLLSSQFDLPKKTKIDRSIVLGATLFGLGWGLSGFCPGPAIVSLTSLAPKVLVFCSAMLSGFALYSIGSYALNIRPSNKRKAA